MKTISFQELALLISHCIDRERLFKENPSVNAGMIDAFFLEILKNKKNNDLPDTSKVNHTVKGTEDVKYTKLILYTDGASRGNPGLAGIGVAIFTSDHLLVEEACEFIGKATNNVAEYRAIILAARKAVSYSADKALFKSDSELLVRQLKGIYRVKNPNILPLYHELITILDKIPHWKIEHIRREENSLADTLANRGIDSGT
ncbi:MAG: ribonuclease HI family protein [Candidatus Brocadiaceae bacterium]|nr:ribonuclease HI family protein [Candidatus Brocadiaceae bacterium]